MISNTKCNKKELKISDKKCIVSFDGEEQSSDGGFILISKIDQKLGITKRLSCLIKDKRNPSYIKHNLETLIQQRIYGICQGYEDCNDHDLLRHDKLLQLVLGQEDSLASQPTLCRFENESDSETVYNLEEYLMDNFVTSLSKKDRNIVLDIDPTDDQTYGAQQLTFFRGYYNKYMYYPLLVYHYPTGRLAAAMLRPGNAGGSEDSSDLLTRLIKKIKKRFPNSRIIVRGDCAFGHSEILDTLENLNRELGKISYTLGISSNNVLKERSQRKFDSTLIKWELESSTEKSLIKYGSMKYKAKSWSCQRRVIYKVEISSKKKSRRFIVTNMRKAPSKSYEEYRKRGQCENWINDFKNGVDGDRLSCTDWFTNQFRFFMHSFSYVIMNEFRLLNKNTEYSVMRLWNLRLKLLKVSVLIKKTTRAIRLRLPISFPFQKRWLELLTELK